MKVVVIGSSNIDMVAQVSHLPAPGETVGDANFMQSLGGKGANQAVAAARLKGNVHFIAKTGNDGSQAWRLCDVCHLFGE